MWYFVEAWPMRIGFTLLVLFLLPVLVVMPSTGGSDVTLTLLPAVDVADGRAVRLVQGAAGSETVYGDPLDAALAWQGDGAEWIHLVDLDAAFGRGSNADCWPGSSAGST